MPGPRRYRDNNTGEEFTMDWYGNEPPTPDEIRLYRQQQHVPEDRSWYNPSRMWDTATHGVEDAIGALQNIHPVDALMGEEKGLQQSAQSLWDYAPDPVKKFGTSVGNVAKGAAALLPPVTVHRYRPEDDPALRLTGQPDPISRDLGWQVSTPAQDIAAGMMETGRNAVNYAGTALGNLSSNASDLADRYLFAPGSEPYQPPIEHRPIASPILHAAASIPEIAGLPTNTALTEAEQGNPWGAAGTLVGGGALLYGLGRAHAGGEGLIDKPTEGVPGVKGVKRTTPVEPAGFDMEGGWGETPRSGAPQDITNNPFLSEDIALIREQGTVSPDQLGSAEAIQEYAAHLRGEVPQAPDLPPVQPPAPAEGGISVAGLGDTPPDVTPPLDIHSPFLAEDIQLIREQGTITPEQLGTPEAIQQYAEEIRQGTVPPEPGPPPPPTDPWARQPLEQPPPGPPEDLPLQPTGPELPPPTDLPLQDTRTPSNPELMAEQARFSQALEATNRPPPEAPLPDVAPPEAPPVEAPAAPVDQPGPGSTFGGVRGFGQWTGREIWDVWKKEAMDMGEDPTHLDMAKQVADAFGENITHSDDLADFDHHMLDKYGDAYTKMVSDLVEHGVEPTPQPHQPAGFSLSDLSDPNNIPPPPMPEGVPDIGPPEAPVVFPSREGGGPGQRVMDEASISKEREAQIMAQAVGKAKGVIPSNMPVPDLEVAKNVSPEGLIGTAKAPRVAAVKAARLPKSLSHFERPGRDWTRVMAEDPSYVPQMVAQAKKLGIDVKQLKSLDALDNAISEASPGPKMSDVALETRKDIAPTPPLEGAIETTAKKTPEALPPAEPVTTKAPKLRRVKKGKGEPSTAQEVSRRALRTIDENLKKIPDVASDMAPKKGKIDPAQALADIFNKKAEEIKDVKWNPDVNKPKVGELPSSKSARTQLIVDELSVADMKDLVKDDKALTARADKGGVAPEGLRQSILRYLKNESGQALVPGTASLKKLARSSFDVVNQARMTSMLSGLAIPKSFAGNIGSHLTAALEHRTLEPFKVLTNVRAIAKDLKTGWVHNTNPAMTAGVGRFNLPGRIMGASDYAATESLVRAGISRADAREIMLTNANAIAKWPPFKGRAGQFFIPFKTIPFNQLGQALTRWKKYPGVYTAAVVLGALSGAKVKDKEQLAILSAFAGPYAVPFLAGAAISGGARNLEGISPIPEWGIVKTLTKPWAAFTESPARRWFRTNMGFGAAAAKEKKVELGQSVGKMPGARTGRGVRRGH